MAERETGIEGGLAIGSGVGELDEELIWAVVDEHERERREGFERLWEYYRNDLDFGAGGEGRLYRAAQEAGLPRRLVGSGEGSGGLRGVGSGRREVVVENDIAWRIHTLVDFTFGKRVKIESLVEDRSRAEQIECVLWSVLEANGGMGLFQEMSLLGSVYGFVDVLVRAEGLAVEGAAERGKGTGDSTVGSSADGPASKAAAMARAERSARALRIETVEAPRAIPVLDPGDYRKIVAYILSYRRVLNEVERSGMWERVLGGWGRGRSKLASVEVTEVWEPGRVAVYENRRLVGEGENRLGVIPVVHVQNLSQPLFYEGLSDVEPLIPLQDELNTRLSDRANRVTLQSFKMYLGKGIERFTERPVGPGQMWMTENAGASIEEFGGDGASPSEESHIREVREAMDKASGVTPVSAGLLSGRIGNLSSANALRVMLMGLLSKTERKRLTYGKGIERLAELVLGALDRMGVFRTGVAERRVRLHWPSPLPENETERLEEAERKVRIGVPRERVLAELGYGLGGEVCV